VPGRAASCWSTLPNSRAQRRLQTRLFGETPPAASASVQPSAAEPTGVGQKPRIAAAQLIRAAHSALQPASPYSEESRKKAADRFCGLPPRFGTRQREEVRAPEFLDYMRGVWPYFRSAREIYGRARREASIDCRRPTIGTRQRAGPPCETFLIGAPADGSYFKPTWSFDMLTLTKRRSVAIALMIGLSVPLSIPAFSDPIASNASMVGRNAPRFARGDLVRLRSGGPLMTINDIQGDRADCFWADENSLPQEATFPVYVLQKF
jgi:uncharacterized protein YodC (DUF2158 family)